MESTTRRVHGCAEASFLFLPLGVSMDGDCDFAMDVFSASSYRPLLLALSGERSVADNVLEVKVIGMIDCLFVDGLDHFLYMYKRERVPILEGTCPFVNGPFGMLALSIKVTV